jgi:hypothetical protein
MAATMALTMSDPVEVTTRATNVDAFMPWSTTQHTYASRPATRSGEAASPDSMRR